MAGTVLGLPLIMDNEVEREFFQATHDPNEPGHPLHVTRGQGAQARTQTYEAADIHHHQPGQHPPGQGMFGSYTDPSLGRPPSRGPAQGQFGSYYPANPVQPVSKGAAIAATVNPVAGAALGVGPLQAAGLSTGVSALIITGYILGMGGLGYWLGGKLAPTENDAPYKWGGAVGNVLVPGVGLGVVALIAMLKDRD